MEELTEENHVFQVAVSACKAVKIDGDGLLKSLHHNRKKTASSCLIAQAKDTIQDGVSSEVPCGMWGSCMEWTTRLGYMQSFLALK